VSTQPEEHPPKLVIGVLGMPDNEATAGLIGSLTREERIPIDFVIYWKPSIQQQWRRLVRKLKRDGIAAGLQRIFYAMRATSRFAADRATGDRRYREYYVGGHNSRECETLLSKEKVDVLILSTDAIISPRILAVPRLLTLNAHPGWIPRHRGVGSNLVQMEQGEWPAVSVHAVDEGIDTGPLIVRERVRVDTRRGLSEIETQVDERRIQLLGRVIREIQSGDVRYTDTFREPSNLVRGVSPRRRRRLDRSLRSGGLTLS
jgi:folate-dependent phosphoribosylglycinamide formyltransferase PurN